MFIVTSPVSAGPHVLDNIFNPSLLPGPLAGQGAKAPLTDALFAWRWTMVGSGRERPGAVVYEEDEVSAEQMTLGGAPVAFTALVRLRRTVCLISAWSLSRSSRNRGSDALNCSRRASST